MLKIKLLLRNRLWSNNMSGDVTLEDICNTQFNIVGVLSHHRVWSAVRHRRGRVLVRWRALD